MKLYADKLPNDCTDCPCYRRDTNTCGLARNDGLPHYRAQGDEVWDDPVVMNCPLGSIDEHDVEVTKQVCKGIVNYVTQKAEVQNV